MRTLLLLFFTSFFNFSHSAEVLTISDSIVDHILYVSEDYVFSLPGQKGGSVLIEDDLFQKIIARSGTEPIVRPGASAVNMLKGLQKLGHHCSLITMIGKDKEGDFFLKSLQNRGVRLFVQPSSIPTGKSACLVTPNGERTMRTFLGASRENDRLQLQSEMFEGISHFHLEGYQLKHRKLVREALDFAKQSRATISLDLSSFEVVRAHIDFIWELLREGIIDIIFANQEEAMSLTGLPSQQAAEELASYCKISVVTMGEKGCYTNSGKDQWQCPAYSVKVYDTIGAGDLFITGFLHGFLTGEPVPTCACWGTLLASHVVEVIGAEIPEDQWEEISGKLGSVQNKR